MLFARALLATLLISLLTLCATLPVRAGTLVAYADDSKPGTIIVDTAARRLYLMVGDGKALRYTVGVGRIGLQWSGAARIAGRFTLPNWVPPAAIRRDRPDLPSVIPGGSPANPMGAAAMTLTGGDYAIHGTNNPASIGGFVSYGCIRMLNEDIIDLMGRVRVGTPVLVL